MRSASPRSARRSRAAIAVAAIVVATLAPVLADAPPAGAAVRPNVLILLSDDQAMGTMRAMPNVLRTIAAPGVRFSRAYISDPLCCPSRASILTGSYPTHTGVFTNGEGAVNRGYGGTAAFENNGNDDRTIAATLQDAGYQTALFGKYLNGYRRYAQAHADADGPFVPSGWDVWRPFYENNGRYFDYDLLRADDGAAPRVVHFGRGNARGDDDYSTTVLGRMLRSWLRHRDASAPFFAYLAPFAPHERAASDHRDAGRFADLPPFTSPALGETPAQKRDMPTYVRDSELSREQLAHQQTARRREFRALAGFDREIRLTMAYLATAIDPRSGRPYLEDTIVVYLSDNGVMWGEHGLTGKAVPYERSTHVPMYLRYDAAPAASGYRPGTTERNLVANVDVAPTIYQLARVAPPGPLDGRSMFAGHGDGVLLASLTQGPRSAPSYCGVVMADGWTYVVYVPQEALIDEPYEDELYQVRKDPSQLDNRADDPTDLPAVRAEDRAKAMLQRRSGGRRWCTLPGVPQSWYRAWA